MTQLKYWLWLANLPKLNNQMKLALLEHFGEPDKIYYGEKEEYFLVPGMNRAAAETLEGLILRHYDALPVRAQARLEADYLPTLERALGELARAERDRADGTGEAALCLRAVNVLSQVVTEGGQSRREWDRRGLEAEVEALERLAAMRGDVAGEIKPTG